MKDTDVKQEYVVARYPVDIALKKLKVAIQVDGPTHYYPDTHDTTRITQLRNRLITQAGWQVVVALGRWKTYGCANIPDDNQQEAISLILV